MIGSRRAAGPVVALLLCLPAGALAAQGAWDAMLTIQPYPSPYYSDWEADPNIGSLTLINHSSAPASVRIYFTIADAMNRVVASGTSDPETIAAGAVAVYDSPYEIAGTASHDEGLEEIAVRTGRLPEGDYLACASAADDAGFVLAESCAGFFIAYPDPPLLLGPEDGARLEENDPLFQWTPVRVPVDYQLTYALRVVEVLPGQLPAEALRSNIPHHEQHDAFGTTVRYPIDALPLEPGKSYAWSVRAVDQNGYAASANEGRSEIWTFDVKDPVLPETRSSALTVSLHNSYEDDAGAAGDAGTASAASAASATPGDADALAAICTNFDQPPDSLDLSLSAFTGFPRNDRFSADLFRDHTTGKWAIVSERARLTYLLYGSCRGATSDLGGLEWIAVRPNHTGTLSDLTDGMPVEPGPGTELDLRYGVLILSLYKTSTSLPDDFVRARDFLDMREIDIQPGLNVFAVVDLREHAFWPVFEALGYTNKYVELQGFAGISSSWSVGGKIGGTMGAVPGGGGGVTVSRSLFYLQASFPERRPVVFTNLFETSQASLAVEVKDKNQYSAGTGGLDSSGELEMELTAALSIATNRGYVLTGSMGRVLGQEHQALAAQAAGTDTATAFLGKREWKTVLKLGTDSIPVHDPFYIGGAELEVEINEGFREMVRSRNPRALDWGAKLAGSLRWGSPLSAKVEVGIGRNADVLRATRGRADADADIRRPTRPRSNATAAKGSTAGGRSAGDTGASEDDGPPVVTTPTGAEPEPTTTTVAGQWKWEAKVAFGNLSLQNLLRLIRQSMP